MSADTNKAGDASASPFLAVQAYTAGSIATSGHRRAIGAAFLLFRGMERLALPMLWSSRWQAVSRKRAAEVRSQAGRAGFDSGIDSGFEKQPGFSLRCASWGGSKRAASP